MSRKFCCVYHVQTLLLAIKWKCINELTEYLSGNGINYDHKGFLDFMLDFRKHVTDRKLVSQTFIAVPSDSEGKEGTVARVAHTTGIQDGEFVNFRSAAVATFVFDEGVGRRMIIRETFAVQTE